MRKLHLKVIFYLTARYFLFLIIINAIFKEVKWVKWSDLNSAEDWFMFAWLFILPLFIEIIAFTLPFSNGLKRIEISKNRISCYLFFGLLFLMEFIFCNSILAKPFNYIKVLISVVLFFLYFRRSLFKKYFPTSENNYR